MDGDGTAITRRPTIAFVHQPWSIVYPGEIGADSVVLWTDQVSRRLARTCDVICYSRAGGGLPDAETVDGVEHRRVSGRFDRYVKHAFHKLDQWGLLNRKRPGFASPLVYRHFIAQVARDLASQDVDYVHVHNTTQFLPVLRSHLPDAKIGVHMHCEWLSQLDRDMLAGRLMHADLIVGVSDFVCRKVRQRFPEFADRCRRVWNGADVERFDVSPSANRSSRRGGMKRLLYVGRISPEKGIHTLLEAFRTVARERDDVHLQIVGPERVVAFSFIIPMCEDPKVLEMTPWYRGGYMDHLRKLVDSLPAGRAELLDREVPHFELPRVYADADIFAFPSIWDEPFGMPLVEAMAAGLPSITTRTGAFPEIVRDGITGLMVERADTDALAEAILRLCADDDLRLQMGQAARARARELFSWDHVAESLLREYRSAPQPLEAPEEATPAHLS